MIEVTQWDKEKGALLIAGRRHTAIDAQTLCDHLDSLVGPTVAGVQIHSLEYRLGKEDAARIRKERPEATVQEMINLLIDSERFSGMGVPKVTLLEDQQSAIFVEISNPSVRGTGGAAKAFLFSWWAGAFFVVFGADFDLKEATYEERGNVMRCRIVPRKMK